MTEPRAVRHTPTPLISIAPMMDWTDRHCRYFHRLMTRHTLLYTEMIPTGAIVFGDVDRFLRFDPAERPVALQVGGSDPEHMARCAEAAERYGYDEININVGCPSSRVKSGRFGACLMAEPERVAACVTAMRRAARLPVTVKTRIGIDDRDSYEHLLDFVDTVAAVGCETFIIHARKAWLSGLSPKENRQVPPLRYDVVRRLKADRPSLTIVLNGGVQSAAHATELLAEGSPPVDGVMIGRAAYEHPYRLVEIDHALFGDDATPPTRREVLDGVIAYAEGELAHGTPLKHITRHILGLFAGMPGAKAWRRHLSEEAVKDGADVSVIRDAAAHVRDEVPAST